MIYYSSKFTNIIITNQGGFLLQHTHTNTVIFLMLSLLLSTIKMSLMKMQVLLTPTENTSRTDSMIRQPPTQKGTVISLTHVL